MTELVARLDALEAENRALRATQSGTPAPIESPTLSLPQDSGGADGTVIWQMEQRLCEVEAKVGGDEALPCPTGGCDDGAGDDDLSMTAKWNHGLELATKNKDFRIHVGGRTQFDTGWFDAPPNVQNNINNPYEDGVDFRRGRLRVDGTMYSVIEFAVEYDFFNAIRIDGVDRAVTAPTDLWWECKETPYLGHVRFGNQKPAIGFEHLVSSRFLPFMERSYSQDAFYGGLYNGFWPGIAAFDSYGDDEHGTYNMGLFKPTNNVFAFNATDGDYAVVGRLTRLAWYECEGASLFHVGGSVMQQAPVDDRHIFRTRDAIRTGLSSGWPVPASTGDISGDDIQFINSELAAVEGPWTFQAEYTTSYMQNAAAIVGNVVQPGVGTVNYNGGYVQVLYFLTGEHDRYNKLYGAFERVIPHENYFVLRNSAGQVGGGRGAWQIGARYNYLDLNDNGLNGGILHNVTTGLNWFWNPNMKIQFDYMATHRDAALAGNLGDGWINGWGIRVASDF